MSDADELLDLAAMLEKKGKLATAKAALHRHHGRSDDAEKEDRNAEYCARKAEVCRRVAKRKAKVKPGVFSGIDSLGFLQFWNAFPRKVGKATARNAWVKWKCEGFVENVLAALARAKASADWKKEAGAFVPHPGTWLNREGWEDDFTSPTKAATQSDPDGWREFLAANGHPYSTFRGALGPIEAKFRAWTTDHR